MRRLSMLEILNLCSDHTQINKVTWQEQPHGNLVVVYGENDWVVLNIIYLPLLPQTYLSAV